MDDIVKAAMARWAGVPDAFGWLRLDRRGKWWIKGSPVENPVISDFIQRNYESDATGRWFFQNGPQRVFVEIDGAPWVVSAAADVNEPLLITHSDRRVRTVHRAFQDETGALYLDTDLGPAIVDDRSLAALADHLGESPQGIRLMWREVPVPVQSLTRAARGDILGFVAMPRPEPGQPEC